MLQNWLIDWICSFFIQISWGPCHQSSVLSKKNDFMSLFLVLESSSVARKSRMKLSLASLKLIMKLIEELCIFKKCFKIGLLTESVLFLSKSPEGPVTSRRCYQRKMTLCPSFWFSSRLRSPERAEWSFHWLHFDEKYFGSIFIPSSS